MPPTHQIRSQASGVRRPWSGGVAVVLVLLFLSFNFAEAADYTEIVTFGDSMSDMGNRGLNPANSTPKWRETWVKQLAGPDMLNLAIFKPSGMTAYYGGTNYAVGGAYTEYTARQTKDYNRGQNLTQQVSKRYLNAEFNVDGVRKDALHIIVIGTNDLSLAMISPAQLATQWAGLDTVAQEVARSTEGQIQALAAAGVRHVLWGNLFDAAKAPSVTTKVTMVGGAMAPTVLAALTHATLAHNLEMDAAMTRLRQATPGLEIIKLDLATKFAEVSRDPGKYGFADVTTGANDARHLFSADGLHPTPAGHKMLAEFAYATLRAASPHAQPAAGEKKPAPLP